MNFVATDLDWNFILQTIEEEKCILFLGPEVFSDASGVDLEERIAAFLKLNQDPQIIKYEDGLYYFHDPKRRTWVYYQIKEFYQQAFPEAEALFAKLAQIPFTLVLTLTPDKRLWEVHRRLNVRAREGFYWKKQVQAGEYTPPTRNNPVIYNLLGSLERLESMVLTHNDLFDYFESIFQGNTMPEKLRHQLKEANNYMFLGIHFRKWYMQLLLRILYLHSNENLFKYASNLVVDATVQSFYFEQFQISFIPDKITEFVDDLYEKAKEKGLLRSGPGEERKKSVLEEVIQILSKDEVDNAFALFKEFLEEKGEEGLSFEKEVTLLESRHHRLERKVRIGVITFAESEVEANKIRESLLELLIDAKALE